MWVKFLPVVFVEMGLWKQVKSAITRMMLGAQKTAKLTQDLSVEDQVQHAIERILSVGTTSLKLLRPAMMGT